MNFKDSFRPDMRLVYVALMELSIIILLFLVYIAFTKVLISFGPELASITSTMQESGGLDSAVGLQNALSSVYYSIIVYVVIFVLIGFVIFALSKYLIYCVVDRVRPTKKILLKWLVASLAWGVIVSVLIYAVQFVLYFLFKDSIITSRFVQFVVLLVMVLALVSLFNLTVFIFTALLRSGSLKKTVFAVWPALKAFRIAPVLLVLFVFVPINLLILILTKIPSALFLILVTMLLFVYFAWARLYLTPEKKKIKLKKKKVIPKKSTKTKKKSVKQ
ncbi:hypothetical protein HQ545_01625 [Candidatus Woesearchaeota archaeon]|nr:hypothetical protein [Candidatus Woesearchaeota archaeon]